MIVIIDGYNVLKNISRGRFVSEKERADFIMLLSKYKRIKKHAIIVVFDGGPSTWPSKEVISKINIIFSGSKRTADAVIMKYLKEHVQKEMVLISADNELCHFANKLEIVSLGSQEFYTIIQDAVVQKNVESDDPMPDIDVEHMPDDLDSLMEAASQVIPHKKEDAVADEQRPQERVHGSKTERRLLKILNKL